MAGRAGGAAPAASIPSPAAQQSPVDTPKSSRDQLHSPHSESSTPRKKGKPSLHSRLALPQENEDTHFPELEAGFDVLEQIGKGTFSVVYKGVEKTGEKRTVALKRLVCMSDVKRMKNEMECLDKLGGTKHVVGFYDAIYTPEQTTLVLPYFPHQHFKDYYDRMTLAQIQSYMRALFESLEHLHSHNIIHRDIKPSNFLHDYENKGGYCLVDFGLAQWQRDRSQSHSHTPSAGSGGAGAGSGAGSGYRSSSRDGAGEEKRSGRHSSSGFVSGRQSAPPVLAGAGAGAGAGSGAGSLSKSPSRGGRQRKAAAEAAAQDEREERPKESGSGRKRKRDTADLAAEQEAAAVSASPAGGAGSGGARAAKRARSHKEDPSPSPATMLSSVRDSPAYSLEGLAPVAMDVTEDGAPGASAAEFKRPRAPEPRSSRRPLVPAPLRSPSPPIPPSSPAASATKQSPSMRPGSAAPPGSRSDRYQHASPMPFSPMSQSQSEPVRFSGQLPAGAVQPKTSPAMPSLSPATSETATNSPHTPGLPSPGSPGQGHSFPQPLYHGSVTSAVLSAASGLPSRRGMAKPKLGAGGALPAATAASPALRGKSAAITDSAAAAAAAASAAEAAGEDGEEFLSPTRSRAKSRQGAGAASGDADAGDEEGRVTRSRTDSGKKPAQPKSASKSGKAVKADGVAVAAVPSLGAGAGAGSGASGSAAAATVTLDRVGRGTSSGAHKLLSLAAPPRVAGAGAGAGSAAGLGAGAALLSKSARRAPAPLPPPAALLNPAKMLRRPSTQSLASNGQHRSSSSRQLLEFPNAPRSGTRGFRAPEVLLRLRTQTVAIDIWSAGVIFLCLLTRRYPFFAAPDDLTALMEIVTQFGEPTAEDYPNRWAQIASGPDRCFWDKKPPPEAKRLNDPKTPWQEIIKYLSAEALSGWSGEQVDAAFDLLTRCLEYSPQRRIAAHEALRHPFFALDPTTAAVVSPGASSTASSSSAAAAPG